MAEQRRMRPVAGFVALGFCGAFGGLVACSSNNGATGGNSGEAAGDTAGDGAISCAGDPRTEPFAINLTHKGTSGLSFVIVGSNFSFPAVNNVNTWTVKVLDASGAPVKDAVLTLPKLSTAPSNPWMPDHPHGAFPATAKNNNDGTYAITPLYFTMGGVWSTYILAQSGAVTDSTTFTFCVGS